MQVVVNQQARVRAECGEIGCAGRGKDVDVAV